MKDFNFNGFCLFGLLGFFVGVIFCIAVEEMLACYCLYSVKDAKFISFF